MSSLRGETCGFVDRFRAHARARELGPRSPSRKPLVRFFLDQIRVGVGTNLVRDAEFAFGFMGITKDDFDIDTQRRQNFENLRPLRRTSLRQHAGNIRLYHSCQPGDCSSCDRFQSNDIPQGLQDAPLVLGVFGCPPARLSHEFQLRQSRANAEAGQMDPVERGCFAKIFRRRSPRSERCCEVIYGAVFAARFSGAQRPGCWRMPPRARARSSCVCPSMRASRRVAELDGDNSSPTPSDVSRHRYRRTPVLSSISTSRVIGFAVIARYSSPCRASLAEPTARRRQGKVQPGRARSLWRST